MVNTIKVEICHAARDIKGNRLYTPEDITAECNLPILYGKNLDDELDVASFERDSTSKTPLEPGTRVIIRVNETDDIETEPVFSDDFVIHTEEEGDKTHVWAVATIKGCKKIYYYTKTVENETAIYSKLTRQLAIYRLVNNDTPTQIVFGNNPRWKHRISLIEPTKIIERLDCDNENITHSIVANEYETLKETVEHSCVSSSVKGWHLIYSKAGIEVRGYSGSDRFKQPYIEGDIMPLNARLNIKGRRAKWGKINAGGGTLLSVGTWGYIWSNACTLGLSSMTITTPAGQTVDVTHQSTYALQLPGSYTIKQKYTGSGSGHDYTYTAQWNIIVWSAAAPDIKKKTIAGVIDKLLATNPLRRDGLESPKYALKASLRNSLNNISAPEFTFTLGHLMDNLSQVGGFIHAIPRVVPNEFIAVDKTGVYLNDWQNWNVIDFDFLGEDVTFENDEETNQEGFWGIDDYASNFVTNVENALQTNFRSYTSVIEPFDGGFISPRTESSDFIITDDNCVIKTSLPIYRILSLKASIKGITVDLTDYIVEYNKYQTLSAYSAEKDSKAVKIYYTKGSNIIKGLEFEPDAALDIIEGLFDNTAIRNITGGYDGAIKDLAFNITYIPYRNFKARQYRMLITNNENSTLFYNQQSNVVDIEAYGESIKGALLRTGNPVYVDTFYFKSFENIPNIGMVRNDGYYIYAITTEIYNNLYKCTIKFSKDFNKLNEYTGIKSDYRQYEISETESSNRNPDYGEFCILSIEPDTRYLEESTEEDDNDDLLTDVQGYLSCLGWQDFAITQMRNKLNLINGSGTQGERLSFAYMETSSIEYDSLGEGHEITHKILLPLSCFSFGNSILLHCKAQDNYAAGTSVANKDGAKALEEYVEYSDFYGTIDSMKVAFGIGSPIKDDDGTILKDVPAYSKKLYDFDAYSLNEGNLVADFRNYPFWLDKDSREAISFSYQLHFVTNTPRIQIGKSLSEIWGFVGDTASTLKVVEFYKMPNKFNNKISDYSSFKAAPEYTNLVTQDFIYKRLHIKAPERSDIFCVGWGVITDSGDIVFAVKGYYDVYFEFRHKN